MGDQDEVDDQGRSVKKCKLCGVSCFTKTPLVRGSPLQEGWGDQIPWFRGTCDSPVGRFDKPCVLAYNLSMLHDKGPLKVYVKNIAKDPRNMLRSSCQRAGSGLRTTTPTLLVELVELLSVT